MATYVLVQGFYFGPEVWDEVAQNLRASGHQVFTVSLTGQGDRAAEASPKVDIQTHAEDIMGLLEGDGLREVVLVAHSGATMAVTAVADRIPERLARLVYIDTAPFPDGMAQLEFFPPEVQQLQRRQAEEKGEGWLLPAPPFDAAQQEADPVVLGELDASRLAWMREHATPQPFRLATEPARRPAVIPATPKTMVACSFPVEQVRALVDAGVPSFSMLSGPEWSYVGLPTGHWPMLSRPKELAEILDQQA